MGTLTFNLDEARATLILARAVYMVPELMEVIEIYRDGGLNNRQIVIRIADKIREVEMNEQLTKGKIQ